MEKQINNKEAGVEELLDRLSKRILSEDKIQSLLQSEIGVKLLKIELEKLFAAVEKNIKTISKIEVNQQYSTSIQPRTCIVRGGKYSITARLGIKI